jgi:hypothetical protein
VFEPTLELEGRSRAADCRKPIIGAAHRHKLRVECRAA